MKSLKNLSFYIETDLNKGGPGSGIVGHITLEKRYESYRERLAKVKKDLDLTKEVSQGSHQRIITRIEKMLAMNSKDNEKDIAGWIASLENTVFERRMEIGRRRAERLKQRVEARKKAEEEERIISDRDSERRREESGAKKEKEKERILGSIESASIDDQLKRIASKAVLNYARAQQLLSYKSKPLFKKLPKDVQDFIKEMVYPSRTVPLNQDTTAEARPRVVNTSKMTSWLKAHVASVAVMDGSKILMGKRRDNGRWTLPGGHFDDGEDKFQAVARELKEEAGIDCSSGTLEHLGNESVTTFTGKRNTIHAFKLTPNDKVKPTVKNDPDMEVQKWEWIETMEGLPEDVLENLHSPKNVVLQKLGLQTEKAMFFITDIFKSAHTHKYIRKYKRGDKWIYIYHEAGQQPRRLEEQEMADIKLLAENGHEGFKQLHESIQAHDENDLNDLRMLADGGNEEAKAHLKSLGIDREKEKLEDALLRRENEDDSEKELSTENKNKWMATIKEEVDREIFRYLAGHSGNPRHTKLVSAGININSVMDNVSSANTPKDILNKLHEEMSKIDQQHEGLPATQNSSASNAGGYGNLAYNKAVQKLEANRLVPEGMSQAHKRGAGEHRIPKFKKIREEIEKRKREEEERRRAEEERRREEERRLSAELEGSMASFMSSISSEPMSPATTLKLHKTLKTMFGKSMRKEDWPYDFSDKGIKVKIKSISIGEDSVVFSFEAYEGTKRITRQWDRSWSKLSNGGVKIKNSYLAVDSSARGGARLGDLVNRGQRKMLLEHSPKGEIHVYAALDVGGYNWANQGFEFSSGDDSSLRSEFSSFLSRHGVELTREELAMFKSPCHFSAFDNGKRIVKETDVTSALTPQQISSGFIDPETSQGRLTDSEISSGKTKRMAMHLGKAFLLGRSWDGVWKVSTNSTSIASKFAEVYKKDGYKDVLGEKYKETERRVSVGRREAPPSGTSPPSPPSPPRMEVPSGGGGRGVTHSDAIRLVNRWKRSERNIVMNSRRARILISYGHDATRDFLNNAPITRQGRNLIREELARVGKTIND